MLVTEQKELSDNWKKNIRKEIKNISPYIPGKPISEVKREYGLDKIVKLASNENPLGISNLVRETILKECENINRYPDGSSYSLKQELCQRLNITEDMILFGNGSDGLLKVIGESFLNNDSNVIIPYPTFVEYSFVAYLMGSQLIRVWMNNYHQDLKAIVEAVNSKTRLIFLTSPHNPAGTIFTEEEFTDFLELIPDNVIIIMDQAYFEYVQNDFYPEIIKYIKKGYPIISLRTFSKAYGLAGLRLGYAIANREIIDLLTVVRDPFNVNHLAEVAGKAALKDTEFLSRTIQINEEGKKYLYSELEKRGLTYVPTEANFILINFNRDSMDVFKELMKMGVIVRPGKPLGYPEHIRLTIGLPEENRFFKYRNCFLSMWK